VVLNGAESGEVSAVAPDASPEASFGVAALISLSGGFLDAFTYVGHGQVFANAMTGNIVLLGAYGASGEWRRAFIHIPPILAFLVGVFLAHALRHYGARGDSRRAALLSLTIEMLTLGALAFVPPHGPDLWLVLAISLVAALQNSSFTRLCAWSYNSVMTTGNLRRFAENLFEGLLPRRDSEALLQVRVFGAICLSFLAGACLGGLAAPRLENLALLLPVAMLGTALARCLRRRAAEPWIVSRRRLVQPGGLGRDFDSQWMKNSATAAMPMPQCAIAVQFSQSGSPM